MTKTKPKNVGEWDGSYDLRRKEEMTEAEYEKSKQEAIEATKRLEKAFGIKLPPIKD